jgi:O-antigen ligase
MILFYLLVLSLPFVDHGLLGRQIAGLTLEKIIGAACFVYALAYLARRRTMPALFASAQAKAFALYVAIAVTSYVLTAEEITFRDFVGIFVSQFLFFITVMILVDSMERLQNTVLFLIASSGLVSLYLIREWVANVGMYGMSYRPGWVAGDPNMFCVSALVMIPVMFYPLKHAARGWQRAGVAGCLGVTLIAFVMAGSRGGFIGLFCMFLWHLRDTRRRAIAILVCVVIVAVCFVSPYSPLDRLLKPTASDTESSNIRLQLWSASGKIFADHPLFGVGLWNFPKYMHRYLPPGVDLDFVVPHNTYLEAAVDLGIVGLFVFVSVLALSLWNLERMRRSALAAKDAYLAALTGGLSSGLVGFSVAVLFLSAMHAKVLWFAVFLSACLQPLVALSVRAAREKDAEASKAQNTVAAPAARAPEVKEHIPISVGNWLTRH